MRTGWRYVLAFVLVVDVAVAVMIATGGLAATGTATQKTAAGASQPSNPDPAGTRDAIRKLGEQLAQRSAELDRRQAELDEARRGAEVLKRAGLLPEEPAEPEPAPAAAGKKAGAKGQKPQPDAFTRLQRAYENMEPDSAAKALAELADRDKKAVVKMLVGWKPRTSGAILDALTQLKPALSADLSYEIWRKGGNVAPDPADNDR